MTKWDRSLECKTVSAFNNRSVDFTISQVIKEKIYDHTIDTEKIFTNLNFHS